MRDFLTGNTLANEAKMRRLLFKGAFLLVEGDSDERLFGIFVDCEKCQIIVCNGRQNLFEACSILNDSGFAGVLAICDADFDHLEERKPPFANLLLTDLHDAECMMLRGAAFDRVISQFVSREKFNMWCISHGRDVREYLLANCASVGFLLWHSNMNQLGLSFDNLDAKEYLDRDSLKLDPRKLVQHVKNKSSRHDLESERLIAEMDVRRSSTPDLWQVVRGHDIVGALSFAFRYAWGSASTQSVSIEMLEKSLRLAFPAEEFIASALFRRIGQWMESNPPFQVFK